MCLNCNLICAVVPFEKQTLAQLIKKFPAFLVQKFITFFTKANNWPCPETDESSLQQSTLLLKIHLIIIYALLFKVSTVLLFSK